MSTRKETAWWLKLLGASFLSLAFAFASPAIAQDEAEDEATVDEDDSIEEILVTGSRLKRTTYSSVSPLQVISAEVSREVGLIDPASIMQESTAASGAQIDLSFQGYVLDNGPGSSTISLRGLGSNRTLVLINGRRAAPAGVEGAPYAADLNLIPGSLVAQYDVLLDGASSVYGSDAVAGVTNIILRKDFDGLEVEGYSSIPEQSGGVENTLSLVYGKNLDRGFFGVGVEFSDSEGLRQRERSWTADCDEHYEVDENGVYRNLDVFYVAYYGMKQSKCYPSGLAGRVILDDFRYYGYPFSGFGSVYYLPGSGNYLSDFSESVYPFIGTGVDADGDGVTDISYDDFSINGREREAHLFAEMERISAMAYGEYTLDGEANITPYFEVTYNKRETFADGGAYQLFPWVPGNNPYNPCNPNAAGGVDCGEAWDAFWDQPAVVQAQLDRYGVQYFGANAFYPAGSFGPVDIRPVVSVDGDRTEVLSEVEQLRVVAGAKGDLPGFTWGEMSDWTWDIAAVHTKSEGTSSRMGIRDDRLDLALGWFSTTGTPCENDTGEVLANDVAAGCVPVNMFAPTLYDGVVGDFATSAERQYLFDSRDFETEYTQKLLSAYVTGNLLEISSGPIAAGFGFEWREDEIASIPDAVARDGLFFGFFSDAGAVGSKTTKEAFGEIEIPLLVNRPLAEELTLNVSTRVTKDEFYGSAWTYSSKIGYRPIPSLLLRATYGTSYRAPNLRENFLNGQTGFNTLFDPCAVPEEAWDALTQTYDPAADNRPDYVLANCELNGVDPRGEITYAYSSTEISTDGVTDLTEEESSSLSYGFVWSQPFWEGFDLTIGSSYYRIEVDNTIIEPSAQFIVNDCYNNPNLNSAFCARIQRASDDNTLDFVSAGFLNRDNQTVEGVDVNVALDTTIKLFDRSVDIGMDFVANRNLEISETFVSDTGDISFDDDQGEWGFPDWKARLDLRAEMGDFRFTWSTNFIGAVDVAESARYPFSNIDDGAPYTCFGPQGGDVNCKMVTWAGKYRLHSASLYYRADEWTVGIGIRNVFDEAPPRVDPAANLYSVSNTPIGYGYDINGRTLFINVGAKFDY